MPPSRRGPQPSGAGTRSDQQASSARFYQRLRRRVIDLEACSGLPLVGVKPSLALTFALPFFLSFFSALPFALTRIDPESCAVLPAFDFSFCDLRALPERATTPAPEV